MKSINEQGIGLEERHNMYRIFIHPKVITTIQSGVKQFSDQECAGLLLGIKKDENVIWVLKSSGDGPMTRRSYGSVSPDVNYLNRLIRKAESKGLQFLGEWHKHPGAFSEPSQGDVSTIKQIMDDNNLKEYLAIVVSGSGKFMQINPYMFSTIVRYDKAEWTSRSFGNMPKITYTKRKKEIQEEIAETKNQTEEQTPEMTLEKSKSKYGRPRGLHKMISGLHRKKNVHHSSTAWYESKAGKERLLLEKRLMNYHFANFSLLRRNNTIFWSGVFKGHRIVLKYPNKYPAEPIQITIKPKLDKLQDEKDCYYAVLAAQMAYIRIENAVPAPRPVENVHEGTGPH